MYNSDNFFRQLESEGIHINEEQKNIISNRINSVLSYEPKIGIFGKTGVGKSSLCNALFGKDICPISDVEACTRNPQEVIIGMGQKGIKLLDVPGVGESSERDKEYAELYAKLLPELDLVLWLLKADDRAFSSDEVFYKNIVKPHIDEGKVFFFVLNQADKIEPFREWNEENREPGPKQFQNIHRKIDDVATFFGVTASKIIPVSANEKYNLTKLVDEIVFALPRDKKITVFREVSEENQSKIAHEEVKRSMIEVLGETVINVVETTGNVVIKTVETVGRVAEKAIDKLAEKIDEWLQWPPKPFGGNGSGCFITTSTCLYLNKLDDCYELNKFREFRDEWLSCDIEGRKLIEEYYRIAPTIVDKIDALKDNDKIYANIWDIYLSKCLYHIENKNYAECKELYVQMVRKLQRELC